MDEPTLIIQYINSGGVVALLVVFSWLAYSGRVVSSTHLERIVAQVVKEVIRQLKELESEEKTP